MTIFYSESKTKQPLVLLRNILFVLLIIATGYSCKTSQSSFEKQYTTFDYKVKPDILQKRIFYLLYELDNTNNIKSGLLNDKNFVRIYHYIIASFENALNNRKNLEELSNALFINDSMNNAIKNILSNYYRSSVPFQSFLHDKIRTSNYYELSNPLTDSLLLLNAWDEQVKGINHILSAYLQHKDLIYPTIDSAKFSTQSAGYFDSVKYLVKQSIDSKNDELFFDPFENLAISVLLLNGRNEAGRMVPLSTVNGLAYKKASATDWNKYPYSSILVYGAGPGKTGVHFSSEGKIRCDSALALYRKKLAPFIIVSGGFVHPFMTHYCEAVEMRNYLVNKCNVPANAVIIEPHARHTTTNLRNANRILIENHFPLGKPVLGVSSKSHIDYIAGNQFIKIFKRDIGFVPFTNMTRVAPCEASYMPSISSMQIDSNEPLDP